MNKYFKKDFLKVSLLILILSFSFSLSAHADSGACSDHGGVSCIAGPATDGNAQCNDGSESSVGYWSMKECSVSDICNMSNQILLNIQYTKSPLSIRKLLLQNIDDTIKFNQENIDSNTTSYNQTVNLIDNSYNTSVGQMNTSYQNNLSYLNNSLNQQIHTANATMNQLNPYSGGSDTSASGYAARIQQQASLPITMSNNSYQASSLSLNNYAQSSKLQAQSNLESANFASKTCISYLNQLKTGLLQTPDFCTSTYGQNAQELLTGDCSCKTGYQVSENSCVPIIYTPTITEQKPVSQARTAVFIENKDKPKTVFNSSTSTISTTTSTNTESASGSVAKQSENVDMWQVVKNFLQKLNPFSWFKK